MVGSFTLGALVKKLALGNLDGLAGLAGLADHTGLDRSLLFDAARHALELMGIDR